MYRLSRRTNRFSRALLGAAVLLACLPAPRAVAQTEYPVRPLRFVLGFPPGGTSDIVARAVGEALAKDLGQQVVVDNRPGAAGKIAAELAAKAPPDGYTLLLTSGSYAIAPSLQRDLAYDIQRDFVHVTLLAEVPFMLAVYPKVPARTLQELIAFARARPGQVNFASPGIGSPSHLASELFAQSADLKLTHVPYKGTAPAMLDLVAGRVQTYFTSIPGALAHVRAGRIRALAVTSARRVASMPEVPTMRESGLEDYRANSWYGIAFPRGVPANVVKRVGGIVQKALSEGGLEPLFAEQGLETRRGVTPAEAAEFVRQDVAHWASVIRRAGIAPQ